MNLDRAVTLTAKEEGLRLYAYDDATGQPIIPGYLMVGHVTWLHGICLEMGRVPALPPTLAHDTLEYAINRKWLDLTARAPWVETQPDDVQIALACIAYQLGVDGLLGFKLGMAALQRGDRETAAENFVASQWHKQTPARCERVADIIRGHT